MIDHADRKKIVANTLSRSKVTQSGRRDALRLFYKL